MRLGNMTITSDHLLLGIIRHRENSAYQILEALDADIIEIKSGIEGKLRTMHSIPYEMEDKISLSKDAESAIKIMFLEARALKETKPNPVHLLLAILRGDENNSLDEFNVSYESVRSIAKQEMIGENSEERYENKMPEQDKKNNTTEKKKTANLPVLESFGYDLTKAATEGKLDPVVGRDKEIERLAQILGRRKKNNPVLIGEPGVGKSAIAEGLAIRIADKKVSRALQNKKIISLDVGSLVAGTKYRGQFEERVKAILNEINLNPDIILFIDEMHTLVGAGGSAGSLDAANMLKPPLSRGEIQCIGATTLDEYRQFIEKDGALERRFQKITIEPTTFDETLNILENIKHKYEAHHNVIYTPEALNACVSLSERYISDRCLPDKAIDIMDEAGSRVHINNIKTSKKILNLEEAIKQLSIKKEQAVAEPDFEKAAMFRDLEKYKREELEKEIIKWNKARLAKPSTVDKENIAEVISMSTKIPVNKIAESEGNKLMQMEKILKESIIGQDEAITKVVKAIRRNRAGLKDPNKPIGTFLFMGPTGVGKTQLAKELAKFLFNSTDNIIRLDMSEFMEKHAVSRLIGAPPGYVGYNEGGQLSERVRRKPYSVVLLDEIEKAHPDIFNLLLQVLDEGRLTDSNGRYIDFRNTVLILTSNIGSRELKENSNGMGFANSVKRDTSTRGKSIVEKAVQKAFTPEFLNRLDEQIHFNTLTKEDIEKILDINIKALQKRLDQIGYKYKITKAIKAKIIQEGYNPQYGARPLQRAIQKYIEDPIAEEIIQGK